MRVKGGPVTRRRRKKILKAAKGYYGAKHLLFKSAKEQVMRSRAYAYRDRKNIKRTYRGLWIKRINSAVREEGINYSDFMNGLKKMNIIINRKMLSEIAIHDSESFKKLVTEVKSS